IGGGTRRTHARRAVTSARRNMRGGRQSARRMRRTHRRSFVRQQLRRALAAARAGVAQQAERDVQAMSESAGVITEISGWVVRARPLLPLALRELVLVGNEHLIGEVVALDRNDATIQVYEETE